MDSSVVLAEGTEIQATDLGLRDAGSRPQSGETEWKTLEIEVWERELIEEALKRTGRNVPQAAKLLGIGRATLYRKVEQHGIAR